MKYLLFFFITFSVIYSQEDTLLFPININRYNEIASIKLTEFKNVLKSYPNNLFITESMIEDATTKPIPIFKFSKEAKYYKCGDNIEYLIDFSYDTSDFDFIFTKNGQRVLESKSEDYVVLSIHKYIIDNPNAFVFCLNGIGGFWSINNGHLFKLVKSCFLFFCKIKEENANVYFTTNYGEDYLHDYVSPGGTYIGRRYSNCQKDFNEDDFKKVYIKIIDSK